MACTVLPVTRPSCHEGKGGACVGKILALCDPATYRIVVRDIGQKDRVCESQCLCGQTCRDVTPSDGARTGVRTEQCPDGANPPSA